MVPANLIHSLRRFFGDKGKATVVLGTEVAHARAAQARHAADRASGPSPMADIRYPAAATRLWRWIESPVDAAIELLVSEYAVLPRTDRDNLRSVMTMDDFYELLTFSRRTCLAALRSGTASQMDAAFTALAMIDRERIDWRDLALAAGIVCHTAGRFGLSVTACADRAAQMAAPDTAAEILAVSKGRTDRLTSWGYREVATAAGVVMLGASYHPYAPQADLAALALTLVDGLESEGYLIEDIELGVQLPPVWLGEDYGSRLARKLETLRGCVVIRGVPQAFPDPWKQEGQQLLIFLAEARSVPDAGAIAQAAQLRGHGGSSQIGVASGKLCAVLIQNSFMADTKPLETGTALERLRPLLERSMKSASERS